MTAPPIVLDASAVPARRVPFPHLARVDTAIWRLVLEAGLFPADRFEYDVRLGGAGADLVPPGDPLRGSWQDLLYKRVDVVAWIRDVPTIIEVKEIAGFAALGQLLGYAFLWNVERGEKPAPRLVCAALDVDPDLSPVFSAYGVSLLLLPPELQAEAWLRVSAARRPRAI